MPTDAALEPVLVVDDRAGILHNEQPAQRRTEAADERALLQTAPSALRLSVRDDSLSLKCMLTQDKSPKARAVAAQALGAMGSAELLKCRMKAIGIKPSDHLNNRRPVSDHWLSPEMQRAMNIKHAAAEKKALSKIGLPNAATVSAGLIDKNLEVRCASAIALKKIQAAANVPLTRPSTAPALRSNVSSNWKVRLVQEAANLPIVRPTSAPSLRATSASARKRSKGRRARQRSERVAKAVGRRCEVQRTLNDAAVVALGLSLDDDRRDAARLIGHRLQADDAAARRWAAQSLGTLQQAAKSQAPAVERLLHDVDPGVQKAAAKALPKILPLRKLPIERSKKVSRHRSNSRRRSNSARSRRSSSSSAIKASATKRPTSARRNTGQQTNRPSSAPAKGRQRILRK